MSFQYQKKTVRYILCFLNEKWGKVTVFGISRGLGSIRYSVKNCYAIFYRCSNTLLQVCRIPNNKYRITDISRYCKFVGYRITNTEYRYFTLLQVCRIPNNKYRINRLPNYQSTSPPQQKPQHTPQLRLNF
jgi:hypothetical protein